MDWRMPLKKWHFSLIYVYRHHNEEEIQCEVWGWFDCGRLGSLRRKEKWFLSYVFHVFAVTVQELHGARMIRLHWLTHTAKENEPVHVPDHERVEEGRKKGGGDVSVGMSSPTRTTYSMTHTFPSCHNRLYSEKSAWISLHSVYIFFMICKRHTTHHGLKKHTQSRLKEGRKGEGRKTQPLAAPLTPIVSSYACFRCCGLSTASFNFGLACWSFPRKLRTRMCLRSKCGSGQGTPLEIILVQKSNPINQSTNQTNHGPIYDQSINQSIDQIIGRSMTNQSINRSNKSWADLWPINQSIDRTKHGPIYDQSINQSISTSLNSAFPSRPQSLTIFRGFSLL